METVYSVAIAVCLLLHCKFGKLEVLQTKGIEGACTASCDVCTDLVVHLLKNPKTCSHHCKCLGDLHRMVNQETSLGCRPIKHDVFCRLGRKVDSNGCVLGSCNTWLPCAHENPLANCTKSCPHGYKMDIFGCPLCECLCLVDQVGESIFVHECAMKCNNRYSMVEPPTGGCLQCHCTGPRRIFNKRSCKEAPICPKNCGRWGYWFHCDEKESSCRCDCPMNKIECSRVECSWGHASMVRDEFGCVVGCKCSEETKEDTKDLVKCPSGVKCPLECGPYKLKRMYDSQGCLKVCKCECLPSLCERPCLTRVILMDMYGCPTCSCMPNWAQCPLRCSTSCGFHKRLLPDDERGCPSTCECNCPRAIEANKEASVSHMLRPPLLCPTDCDEVYMKRDRYGCDRCECRSVQCPKRTCLRTCGPHGFTTDANDCETCDCNCPRTDLCAPCTNGHYARDGYDCETCNCECPMLLDCTVRCIYGREVDELGCEKCRCVPAPFAVHKARQPDDHHCLEENCDLDCEFYHISTNGCKKCRCCERLHCPEVNCDGGQRQVDENQCPTCKCSIAKRPQMTVVEVKDRTHCPTLKHCPVQCLKTS